MEAGVGAMRFELQVRGVGVLAPTEN